MFFLVVRPPSEFWWSAEAIVSCEFSIGNTVSFSYLITCNILTHFHINLLIASADFI